MIPTILGFCGISFQMFFVQSGHTPPPLHVVYENHAAIIDPQTRTVVSGALPPKALALVLDWLESHQADLPTLWQPQSPQTKELIT